MVIVKNVYVHKELPSSTGCDALPKQSNTLADKTVCFFYTRFSNQGPFLPDSSESLELDTGSFPDTLAVRAQHRVDDEVVDHRQVVEEGHVGAPELEASDQKL